MLVLLFSYWSNVKGQLDILQIQFFNHIFKWKHVVMGLVYEILESLGIKILSFISFMYRIKIKDKIY